MKPTMKTQPSSPKDLFVVDGDSSYVLVASCLGESSGGGLVSFDGESADVIDRISSTGLAVANGRLLRLLWCRGDFAAPGELLVYDTKGVERYYRIDALSDPHDIAWDGTHYIVVSAGENSILWIGENGVVERKSQFAGGPDSWHLNSLFLHHGELFVAAFGRFKGYREWMHYEGRPCGIIFSHETGKDVIADLDRPHHPRIIDGHWVICNSGARELLQLDRVTGTLLRKVQLDKWSRGLTFSDRYIFVGESARRHRPRGDTGDTLASIAILDRVTWRLVRRVHLPFEEVYDLVLIPRPLLQGVQRGFNTNPQRMSEQVQHSLFMQIGVKPRMLWATGDLLPREECLSRVSVEIESLLPPDSVFQRPCAVENRGSCIFVSAKPHPVVITYRWLHKESGRYIETWSMATRLPASVPPGSSISCALKLRTPSTEGLYELQVSLFQKGRGFFTKIDPANAFRIDIWIHRTGATTLKI
jgi:acetolactate synthase I/II/III large subunit